MSRGKYKLYENNEHPLDQFCEFDEPSHKYYINGKLVGLSVSGLWGRYFEEFDGVATVEKYFDNWKRDSNSKYFNVIKFMERVLQYNETDQKRGILKLWSSGGEEASTSGTDMHLQIELFLNDEAYNPHSVEFQQFLKWLSDFKDGENISAYRTEWSVYDEQADLAGQIDSVFKNDKDEYYMVDWKRCAPSQNYKTKEMEWLSPNNAAFGNKKGLSHCNMLPNTKFYHYVIQQNLYKYLVENKYGITIKEMYLAQFHPQLTEYNCVQVPDLQEITQKIMNDRYEEISKKRKFDTCDFQTCDS